jgi:Uma2 family endonuclease
MGAYFGRRRSHISKARCGAPGTRQDRRLAKVGKRRILELWRRCPLTMDSSRSASTLRTSYSPDCEYVDGRVVERNVGEKGHSILQLFLSFLFRLNRDAWGVEVYPKLRTHVALRRFRIPDVLVTRAGVRFESVLDSPPLIAIEILSPDDRLGDLQEKIDEYIAFGVEHIWIFDPQRRSAWRADRDGLHPVTEGELTVAGTPIRVVLDEVFAELDRV